MEVNRCKGKVHLGGGAGSDESAYEYEPAAPPAQCGVSPFTLELRFSGKGGPGCAAMEEEACSAAEGGVSGVRRLDRPGDEGCQPVVEPEAYVDADTDTDADADGRKLSNGNGFTAAGPGTRAQRNGRWIRGLSGSLGKRSLRNRNQRRVGTRGCPSGPPTQKGSGSR